MAEVDSPDAGRGDVLEEAAAIAAKWRDRPDMLIPVLHQIQAMADNCVEEDVAKVVSQEMRVPLSRIHDVLSFYSFFATKKRGKVLIRLCKTAPCRVKGAQEVLEAFEKELGIRAGESTSDGAFTLETCECIGACEVSPAALVDDTLYGNLSPDEVSRLISSLRERM